jgi:predicted RNA-binding protein YlxR (DUF448 family)
VGRPEPERTCVGCRTTAPKRTLIRVVRSPDGTVAVDPTSTAPGRGAYLHASRSCVGAAIRDGSVDRALKVRLPPDEAARLMEGLIGSAGVNA